MCPARRSPSTQTEYARCAASRSPPPQNASPERAEAPARVTWSSSAARSIASWACRRVAGASPPTNASAARYISIAPGRRESSCSSTTTIPAERACGSCRSRVAGSSHRSASRRRSSTPSNSLPAINAADEADREHRPHPNDLVGDDVEPAADGGLLPVPLQRRDGQFDQVRCPLDVPGGECVADSRRRLPVLVVPLAGSAMQVGDLVGPLVLQVGLQHVREKVVIAVPVTAVVQRDQEQVGAVQRLQGRPTAGLTGHRIAQRAAQPVEQAGAQQERHGPVRFDAGRTSSTR